MFFKDEPDFSDFNSKSNSDINQYLNNNNIPESELQNCSVNGIFNINDLNDIPRLYGCNNSNNIENYDNKKPNEHKLKFNDHNYDDIFLNQLNLNCDEIKCLNNIVNINNNADSLNNEKEKESEFVSKCNNLNNEINSDFIKKDQINFLPKDNDLHYYKYCKNQFSLKEMFNELKKFELELENTSLEFSDKAKTIEPMCKIIEDDIFFSFEKKDIKKSELDYDNELEINTVSDIKKSILKIKNLLNMENNSEIIHKQSTNSKISKQYRKNDYLKILENSNFYYDIDLIDSKISNFISGFIKVAGDGNCFYRAAIYSKLNNIILKILNNKREINENNRVLDKSIIELICFLLDYLKCLNNLSIGIFDSIDKIQRNCFSINKSKCDFTILINTLICILNDIFSDKISSNLITMISDPIIDFSLVYFYKLLLYNYIKKNENSCLTEEFPVLIGNLMPTEYEDANSGKFYFDKFYSNYLLKMNVDAEKIIIYLTPFVLNTSLRIIFVEPANIEIKEFSNIGEKIIFNKSFDNFDNNFNCYDKSDNEFIYLLYCRSHYDIAINLETSKQVDEIHNINSTRTNSEVNINDLSDFFNSNNISNEDNSYKANINDLNKSLTSMNKVEKIINQHIETKLNPLNCNNSNSSNHSDDIYSQQTFQNKGVNEFNINHIEKDLSDEIIKNNYSKICNIDLSSLLK